MMNMNFLPPDYGLADVPVLTLNTEQAILALGVGLVLVLIVQITVKIYQSPDEDK